MLCVRLLHGFPPVVLVNTSVVHVGHTRACCFLSCGSKQQQQGKTPQMVTLNHNGFLHVATEHFVYQAIGLRCLFSIVPCSLCGPRGRSVVKTGVQQIVLFTRGTWEKCSSVSVELNDEKDMLITLSKLTPFNK